MISVGMIVYDLKDGIHRRVCSTSEINGLFTFEAEELYEGLNTRSIQHFSLDESNSLWELQTPTLLEAKGQNILSRKKGTILLLESFGPHGIDYIVQDTEIEKVLFTHWRELAAIEFFDKI